MGDEGLSVSLVSKMIAEKTCCLTRLDRPKGGEVVLFKPEKGKCRPIGAIVGHKEIGTPPKSVLK